MATKRPNSEYKIKIWDAIPKFDADARRDMIRVDKETQKIIQKMGPSSKIGFVLQEAYFICKGQFYPVEKFSEVDQKFAAKLLRLTDQSLRLTLINYSKKTASDHRKKISEKYNWTNFDKDFEAQIEVKAITLVEHSMNKEDIAYELLAYCWAAKRIIPAYSRFEAIINKVYSEAEVKLAELTRQHMTVEQDELLSLLYKGENAALRQPNYKKTNQSEQTRDLQHNAKIIQYYEILYTTCLPLIDSLNLSKETARDMSDWVLKSTLTQIESLKDSYKRFAHLIAFTEYQYKTRQDYSADAIHNVLRAEKNKAKKHHKKLMEKQEDERLNANFSLCNSARDIQGLLHSIASICTNTSLKPLTKISRISKLVLGYLSATSDTLDDQINKVETQSTKERDKDSYYLFLFKNSNSIQQKISDLMKCLDFDESSDRKLLRHILAFKKGINKFSDIPNLDVFSTRERSLIEESTDFPRISKYKVLLFILIDKSLRDKSLTLKHSYRYLTIDKSLITDNNFSEDRENILIASNLEKYSNCDEILSKLGKNLTNSFVRVNKNHAKGLNPFLKASNGKPGWKIETPTTEYSIDRYIPHLLGESKAVQLYEVLFEVDRKVNGKLSKCFGHRNSRHTTEKFEVKHLFASIMSIGTNMGHNLMHKACKSISVKQLRDVELNRLSIPNLKKANKVLIDLIENLPLPTIFVSQRGRLLTSSDGKKMDTAVNSLLANYSFKYFGRGKGVTANSSIDEKQVFFHINVMTSSDREAPYMLESLSETKRTIYPEGDYKHFHSTDTHGYTDAIFSGLFFQGVSFAPRIKNINKSSLYAYETKSLIKNSGFLVGPRSQVINRKLIKRNWENILRLMASIKLGKCNASHIFRMLSASKKDLELYRALMEFGKLLKTQFILNYVDDLELRQTIEKQLSKVELGQKLSGSVFHARSKKLFVGLEDDIERTFLCTNLLKNIVISWNYMFLSDYLLKVTDEKEREEIIDSISKGSVISWDHFNMQGIYDFDHVDIDSLKSTLAEMMKLNIHSLHTRD